MVRRPRESTCLHSKSRNLALFVWCILGKQACQMASAHSLEPRPPDSPWSHPNVPWAPSALAEGQVEAKPQGMSKRLAVSVGQSLAWARSRPPKLGQKLTLNTGKGRNRRRRTT